MATIGFIGLGNMGLPMARHLRAAGHEILAHDIDAAACERAREATLTVAGSPAELAGRAELVILMLPASPAVEAVLLGDPPGEGGIAADLRPGATVIDMSSSDPVRTRALADRLAPADIRYVDAPVSGGVKGAVAASLTIMAGGDIEPVQDVLALMGRVIPTGSVGSGHALKALNNLLSGISLLASSEAMEIGKRFGLEVDTMLSVINTSSGRSFSTEYKWPTFITTETFDAGFGLRLLVKDMGIATELGRQVGLPSVVGELAHALWTDAAAELPADADHTEIARFAAHPHPPTQEQPDDR